MFAFYKTDGTVYELSTHEDTTRPSIEVPDDTTIFNKAVVNKQLVYRDNTPKITWSQIRMKRDELLRATDWAALPDSPTMSSSMASYRQKLRDITTTYAAPESVAWPELES